MLPCSIAASLSVRGQSFATTSRAEVSPRPKSEDRCGKTQPTDARQTVASALAPGAFPGPKPSSEATDLTLGIHCIFRDISPLSHIAK